MSRPRSPVTGSTVNFGHGSSYTFANNRFEAKKTAMALFAATLERFADRQIVDMTGLTAPYDFAFDVMPEDYFAMLLRVRGLGRRVPAAEAQKMLDASSPAALGDALQQIGLRLDARKAPARCAGYRRRAEDADRQLICGCLLPHS